MDKTNTGLVKGNEQITLMDAVKYPEVMELQPRQQHILVFLINGYGKSEIARILGLNKNTITFLTLHHKKFMIALAKLTDIKMDKSLDNASKVRLGFDSDSIAAREKLAQLMKNQGRVKVDGKFTLVEEAGEVPHSVQYNSAMAVLAYSMGKPAEKIVMESKTRNDIVIHDESYDPFKDDPYVSNHPEAQALKAQMTKEVEDDLKAMEAEDEEKEEVS